MRCLLSAQRNPVLGVVVVIHYYGEPVAAYILCKASARVCSLFRTGAGDTLRCICCKGSHWF